MKTEDLKTLAGIAGRKFTKSRPNKVWVGWRGNKTELWQPHENIAQAMEVIKQLPTHIYVKIIYKSDIEIFVYNDLKETYQYIHSLNHNEYLEFMMVAILKAVEGE